MADVPNMKRENSFEKIIKDESITDIVNLEEPDFSDPEADSENQCEHDTDSDLDEDENDLTESQNDTQDLFVGRDGSSVWYKFPCPNQGTTSSQTNTAPIHSECKGDAINVTDPYTAFTLFFDDRIINNLVEYTNKHMEIEIAPNFQRDRDAKPVTYSEMRAFLGLLILSGIFRISHPTYGELFSNEDIGNEFFISVMTYRRFVFISRCICFDDIATTRELSCHDRLAPIRVLYDNVIEKCSSYYNSSECLVVDEMLIPFRGKCPFKQYMPKNKSKYGIKTFNLIDAKSLYCLNMEVYTGQDGQGISYASEDIVSRIVKPVSLSHRIITAGNWCSSIPLAYRLLEEHQLYYIGVLKKSKAEIPRRFLANKNRPVNSTLFGFSEHSTIVSYVPNKSNSVLLLSTYPKHKKLDENSENQTKPEMLTYYEFSKKAMETIDETYKTYSVGRRSRQWSMAVFFHLLNVCVSNSQVICFLNSESRIETRKFFKILGRDLTRPLQVERLSSGCIPRGLRQRLSDYLNLNVPTELEEMETKALVSTSVRKRCTFCPRNRNRASRQICTKCKRHGCSEHLANVCVDCYWTTKS